MTAMFRTATAAALLLLCASTATQAEERTLSGGEIKTLLSDNSAAYEDGAKQVFYKHGATTYLAPGKTFEQGTWKVENDQYCSNWGFGGLACYRINYDKQTNRITWNDEYPARIVKGDIFNQ